MHPGNRTMPGQKFALIRASRETFERVHTSADWHVLTRPRAFKASQPRVPLQSRSWQGATRQQSLHAWANLKEMGSVLRTWQ